MITDSKKLMEYVEFLDKNYLIGNKHILHPIDQALMISSPEVATQWYNLIRLLGIDYNTPCSFLSDDGQWADYTDFGRFTCLYVSDNSYLITSNGRHLHEKGAVASDKKVYKDKKHLRHAIIAFDHYVSYETFQELLTGRN